MNMLHQNSGFFVTGTDTEVGKTLVSGALILKLKEAGRQVVGFKPIVAGVYLDTDDRLLNEDLETLRIASNLESSVINACPYVLKKPAAPHLVAQAEGVTLEIAVITKAYHELSSQFDEVVVEGVGGFLVPLNHTEDLGDVAQAIGLPVILVVGMRLGCINHALLSYEALKKRKLQVAGWIANTLASEMPLLKENIQTLQTRINAPYLGLIPPLPKNLQKPNQEPYTLDALRFAAQHIELP